MFHRNYYHTLCRLQKPPLASIQSTSLQALITVSGIKDEILSPPYRILVDNQSLLSKPSPPADSATAAIIAEYGKSFASGRNLTTQV